MLGLQLVVVDAPDDGHVDPVRRGRDDDFLGPGLEMLRRRLALGEDAGAFERDIDVEFAPGQLRRIAFGGDPDLAPADIDPIVAAGDLARKPPVHTVIGEQVRIGGDGAEIVDADHLDLGVLVLVSRAQH